MCSFLNQLETLNRDICQFAERTGRQAEDEILLAAGQTASIFTHVAEAVQGLFQPCVQPVSQDLIARATARRITLETDYTNALKRLEQSQGDNRGIFQSIERIGARLELAKAEELRLKRAMSARLFPEGRHDAYRR
jgi:hypothetical protein